MDFDFTQEQVMLRNLSREFLARESTPRAVRTLWDDQRGYSETTWQQMADLGLGVARTAGGVTLFSVPAGSAGLSETRNVEMDRTNPTSTLTFKDVAVASDAVVGEVDGGWAIVESVLQRAAVAAAAEMLGA